MRRLGRLAGGSAESGARRDSRGRRRRRLTRDSGAAQDSSRPGASRTRRSGDVPRSPQRRTVQGRTQPVRSRKRQLETPVRRRPDQNRPERRKMKSRRTRAGHAGEAGGRTGKIPDDRQWRKFHQGFCRPIQSGCGRNAAATISGADHAGGTRHPASSIVAAVHWTDRSFRMTSAPARYPPLAVAGASPALPQPFSRSPERRLGRLA